jgi:hypothetical protein
MKSQEKRRQQYRASILGVGKASYQKKYDKAMSGRDPVAAIAAKCLDCMHWQRSRIAACPIVCCPLWPYRPFTNAQARQIPAAAKTRKKPQRCTRSAPRRRRKRSSKSQSPSTPRKRRFNQRRR